MSLIKDLTKVKDEEITLEDVKRAEEIIARANKYLGKPKETNHYYHGWERWVTPYVNRSTDAKKLEYLLTGSKPYEITCQNGTSLLAMNITDAATL